MSRRLLVIALGACGVLLALWFFLLWGPQGGELDDAEARTSAAEATNSELELRVARLLAAQERAPELMADVEQMRRAIPDDPDLAQFILDANEIAADAGVDFLSIAPSKPSTPSAGPPVVNLQLNVTGTYFAVLDYLAGIADLPRLVVVDNLSLTPTGGETGVDQLSVAVTARMFTTTVPGAAPVDGGATPTEATNG